MHKRQKGNRNRLKVIKHLEAEGWEVDVVEKTGRFVKQKDMFGLFDLICIKSFPECYSYPIQIGLVQVSTNKPHPHKKFIAFKKKYDEPRIIISQFVVYDGGKIKMFTYLKDGILR